MAKMIPPYICKDVKSNAERRIFQLIKDANNLEEFTCLHSLGISHHISKRHGEIDIVLVGDGIIICLEIKGGRVQRKDGIWYFTDRYGQTNSKTEGPFAQASSAMYSLKKDIEANFGMNHGYVFGYGVVFPDIKFDLKSPEWDRSLIYDSNSLNDPFSKYIYYLSTFWKNKNRQNNINNNIPKADIVNYLRGDFESATPLWSDVQRMEEEIVKFTVEQYRALDHMEDNPRLIFTGPAGSGKTLLAVEYTRRAYHNRKHTLVLCFNRFLGARLKKIITDIDNKNEYIETNSIHKYFYFIINKAGLSLELDEQSKKIKTNELYDEVLPSLFIKAVEKLKLKKFDCIIIDEGQDLLSTNYLLALDCILEGGFNSGKWAIFLDPGGQALLFNRFSLEAFDSLKKLGAPVYKLDLNVRNTLQIATQTTIISGFPAGMTSIEGPKVEYKLCNDQLDMAIKLTELIKHLIEIDQVPPASITLLTSKNIGSMSLFATGIKTPNVLLEANEVNVSSPPVNKIIYSSAQSFKGLENNIIIYTDLDSLTGKFPESINYVAMTRAKEKLYILMDKKLQKEYQNRINKFAKLDL